MNPVSLFQKWYAEECKKSKVRIPSACCLSSMGTDGYPNARFLSFKEIENDCFIITGPLEARKGKEIAACNKVALSFWWTITERQVRIQGNARPLSEVKAKEYFSKRNTEAQLVSIISRQGAILKDAQKLEKDFETAKKQFLNTSISKPESWGGYMIDPVRIELMEFKATRFHIRTLFEKEHGSWGQTLLQP